MEENMALRLWYEETSSTTASDNIARETFLSSLAFFRSNEISSQIPQTSSEHAASVDEIVGLVQTTLEAYKKKSRHPKLKKWIQRVSERIHHYSNVLDVFVQHHPEYVSLAWGLMKLVFVSVLNHEESLQTIAKSLAQIAERLPTIKLASSLYPSARMRSSIESLYSYIMEFLVDAYKWCKESKVRHLIHSITRPPTLQYKDVLERISSCSRTIQELAVSSSQAELRVMHTSIEKILQRLDASEENMTEALRKLDIAHSLHSSSFLDTNQRLSYIQYSQALASLLPPDHDVQAIFERCTFHRRRRAGGFGAHPTTNKFWASPKLTEWSRSQSSSLALVKGSMASRLPIQDFCVDVIKALQDSQIPTLLGITDISKPRSQSYSIQDFLKSQCYEALRSHGPTTESQMSTVYTQFQRAGTRAQWLCLLKSQLAMFRGYVFLVLDLSAICPGNQEQDSFDIVCELKSMTEELSKINRDLFLKTIFFAYEPKWLELFSDDLADFVVPVRMMKQKGRAPRSNLRRLNLPRNLSSPVAS